MSQNKELEKRNEEWWWRCGQRIITILRFTQNDR